MEKSRKMNKMKLVFGIAIPMLVIVVTMVMVGVSFAWFSNADKTTISEITFSTAESYSVEFGLDQTSGYYDNIAYAGQETLTTIDGKGKLITSSIKGDDSMVQGNTAYYFVNTIKLNTSGNNFDITMAFDYIRIYKPTLTSEGNKQLDSNGVVLGTNKAIYGGIEIGSNSIEKAPYVFTWMFKKHAENTQATNYTSVQGSESKSMKALAPASGETWYTPYGALTFDNNGEYVAKINGSTENVNSIKSVEANNITNFATTGTDGELYDFYIIFAPQKMFYMQFFSADKDKYGIQDVYTKTDENNEIVFDTVVKTDICGTLTNKMFYSDLAYSGMSFDFSALISVEGVHEHTNSSEGGGLNA